MRFSYSALCLVALLSLASCAKDHGNSSTKGGLTFEISGDYMVVDTKSAVSDFTALPSKADFTLTVKDSESEVFWTGKFSDWSSETEMPVGDYTAYAEYGAEGDEGFDKPWFTGSKEFSITGGELTSVTIPVALGNTIVKISTTEMFDNYFTDYTFTVVTGSGSSIEFVKGETRAAFVDAFRFRVNGVLTTQGGSEVTFSGDEYSSIYEQTCYTITFDAPTIGADTISITFDDSTETVELGEVELND